MGDLRDYTPRTLGDAIRMVRKEKTMTLTDVANKAGLSASYMSDIERGRTLPSIESLQKIVVALEHVLTIGMSESGETSFPCTAAEAEMLYALRNRDFERFMIMAASILGKETIDKLPKT